MSVLAAREAVSGTRGNVSLVYRGCGTIRRYGFGAFQPPG